MKAAAHGAHVAGVEIAVNEVLEVRRAVLGGHLEQQPGVWRFPIKVIGDVVGGNGVGEPATIGVTGKHQFDEGSIDHIHFAPAIAVGEILFFALGFIINEIPCILEKQACFL